VTAGSGGESKGDQRKINHERRQRVHRRQWRSACGAVDADGYRVAARAAGEPLADHEIVDGDCEYDHQAGKDRR
jgi:hypothetical protein